jgi:hypothetical protein
MRAKNRDVATLAAALILGSGALAGCSSHTTISGAPAGGASNQAMISAWKSGECPASGTGWNSFASGMPLATAKVGQTVALVPGAVDRILLCRFDLDSSVLTGSALLTDTSTVARLRSDLNSVTAVTTSSCVQGDQVMILAGDGANVIGFDALVGSCPYLNSPAQFADYSKTSLAHDLESALGPVAAQTS